MQCINCAICGEEKEKQYLHKLQCGHEFHYNCLMLTFRNMKNNNCPYCRKSDNLLPLVNGLKNVYYGIHDTENKKNYKNEKCKHILTRGKNKGQFCSNYCEIGMYYCKIHKKKYKDQKIKD